MRPRIWSSGRLMWRRLCSTARAVCVVGFCIVPAIPCSTWTRSISCARICLPPYSAVRRTDCFASSATGFRMPRPFPIRRSARWIPQRGHFVLRSWIPSACLRRWTRSRMQACGARSWRAFLPTSATRWHSVPPMPRRRRNFWSRFAMRAIVCLQLRRRLRSCTLRRHVSCVRAARAIMRRFI